MSGTWQTLMEFLQAPPTWAALVILIIGAFVINLGRELWAFIVAVMLAAFVWLALGTLVASFAMGWQYLLAWTAVALILLYNMGWLVEKERYWMLTVNLLLVLALTAVVSSQVFQLSFWKSVGTGFVVLALYFLVGLGVAVLKWWSFNRKKLDELRNHKGQYFSRLRESHASLVTKADAYRKQQQEVRETAPRGQFERKLEEPEISSPEILAAIGALPNDFYMQQNLVVPNELKAIWERRVDERKLRVPSAYESKERFLAWLTAWPAVLVHLILADLMEHLWRWFYEAITNMLASIQRSVFRGSEEFLKAR